MRMRKSVEKQTMSTLHIPLRLFLNHFSLNSENSGKRNKNLSRGSTDCRGEGSLKIDSLQPNGPLQSCFLPRCQNESTCETIHMKMSSAYRFIFMQIKLLLLEDSF